MTDDDGGSREPAAREPAVPEPSRHEPDPKPAPKLAPKLAPKPAPKPELELEGEPGGDAAPKSAPKPNSEPAGEPEGVPGGEAEGREPISARVRQLAEAVGPTTLATALLVYFGYIATRARFDYFGISLDMAEMSNQSLLLRGLEVIYVPAALICLGALLCIGVHAAVTWQLGRRPGDVANTFLAAGIGLVGLLLVVRALIGIFLQDAETSVVIGTTPLALAFGPALVAYAGHIHGKNRGRPLLSPRLTRNAAICVLGLAVAGLFWGSTVLAWAYGTGRSQEDTHELAGYPEVILDLKEPLVGAPNGITHTLLPATGKDPGFLHRYRGFRLLLASGGRLFLVNPTWTLGRDQTVVVPYDNSIRIQLVSQP
ncbi:hypothetical protein ABZ897_24065 [Nonomuraea sp. NPDC046802]|uniref:hypothetical protein n=1 Tax=Nonomuraea sp. NPDC046802 TaxID=3154919 RepID=UPI00340C0F55